MEMLVCNSHEIKYVCISYWIHDFVVVQSPSCVRLLVTPWTETLQASPSLTISWSLPKFISIESVMPSNRLILCHPFSFCLQSFPESGSFPVSGLFKTGDQSIGASALASVLPMSIQGQFLVLSPCCPRDSQESSPTSQFESINSSSLGLLYGPALTFIHEYWKDHSLYYYRSLSVKWCLCFLTHCLGLS